MYRLLTAIIFAPALVGAADITALSADTLALETTPEVFGFAALNGDHFAESYMATGTLPHGLVSAYYHTPASLAHVSSCVSSVDCVTFLYQPGAFDFFVVSQ